MAEYPQRPRTHVLETESRLAFQQIIPHLWIYRVPTDDYGIDGEVEIVREDGSATGRKFLVQLKATDESSISDALRVRLKKSNWNYWKNLEYPVLIVRYLSSTKNIYTRWVHSFDGVLEKVNEEYIVMKFTDENLWFDGRLNEVQEEVDVFFKINKGKNPFPIKIPVFFHEDVPLITKLNSFIRLMKETSKDYNNIFQLNFGVFPLRFPHTYVAIDNKKIHIILANQTGFCLHLPENYLHNDIEEIMSTLWVSIGMALIHRNFSVQGGKLASEHILLSGVKFIREIVLIIIENLLSVSQLERCIELMVAYFDEDNECDIYQFIMVSIIKSGQVRNENIDNLINKVNYILISLINKGLNDQAASFSYNLGNLHSRLKSDVREAISFYKMAAKLNPDYKNRAYWNSEVAGNLFELNRYYFSSLFYRRAIEIEPSTDVRALYADALMFSGNFKEAKTQFDTYFSELGESSQEIEWTLKLLCIESIINTLEIDKQKRRNADVDFISLSYLGRGELINYLRDFDGLNGCAWYNLGILEAKDNNFKYSVACFMISGFSGFDPIDSFKNAISCAREINDINFASIIFIFSYKKFGQDFLDFYLKDIGNTDKKTELLEKQLMQIELVSSLDELTREERQLTVRMGSIEFLVDDKNND